MTRYGVTNSTTGVFANMDKWDSNSLWESRYIWLPIEIDDKKKTLELAWHDIYDLDVYVEQLSTNLSKLTRHSKTGEWKPIEGKTYYGKDAKTSGDAFKQEAVSIISVCLANYPLTL